MRRFLKNNAGKSYIFGYMDVFMIFLWEKIRKIYNKTSCILELYGQTNSGLYSTLFHYCMIRKGDFSSNSDAPRVIIHKS